MEVFCWIASSLVNSGATDRRTCHHFNQTNCGNRSPHSGRTRIINGTSLSLIFWKKSVDSNHQLVNGIGGVNWIPAGRESDWWVNVFVPIMYGLWMNRQFY